MKTHRLSRVWPWAVFLGLLGCGAEESATHVATDAAHAEALGYEDGAQRTPAYATLSRADRGYLLAVAASHSYQGQMSNLVVTHTHNPDTRDFGRFVVETQQDVRQRLHALGLRYHTAFPAVLSHKQSYRLHKLSCCVWFFEKSYFKYMYKELAILRKQSHYALAHSRNAEVQAWARDTLQTIDLTIRLSAAGQAVFEFAPGDPAQAGPEETDTETDDDDTSDGGDKPSE